MEIKPLQPSNLWMETRIYDPERGTLIIIYPVTETGQPDLVRQPRYRGEIQVMARGSQGSAPMQIGFDIKDVSSIAEAVAAFPAAAAKGLEEAQDQMRRRALASPGIIGGRS